MNCDAIAPFYRLCELIAFGRRLERHRAEYVDVAAGAATALLLGDGDGRFLAALASRNPALQIDYIDLSSRMMALAQGRLTTAQRRRVRFLQADALLIPFCSASYDVVYSHFFLDCFTSEQVSVMAGKVAEVTACWVITDFRQGPCGWRRLFTAVSLKTMYVFFRLATRLQPQTLAAHSAALQAQGFRLTAERTSMAGFIASECWRR